MDIKELRIKTKYIRGRYHIGKLDENRISILNELGFIWDLKQYKWLKKWKINFTKLKNLYEQTGSCDVIYSYPDKELIAFIQFIRAKANGKKNHGSLTPNEHSQLESINFVFRKGYRNFLSLKEAKEYLQINKPSWVTRMEDYRKWIKTKEFPNEKLPRNPHDVYKNDKEWKGFNDYIGAEVSPNSTLKVWKSKEEMLKYVRSIPNEYHGKAGWDRFCEEGKKPIDIPVNLRQVYDMNFSDIFNTTYFRSASLEECKAYARTLKIDKLQKWHTLFEEGKLPSNMPKYPEVKYKDCGWTTSTDFFNTTYIPEVYREIVSAKEMMKFAIENNLLTFDAWHRYYEEGKLPSIYPASPNTLYWRRKDKDWKGWKNLQNLKSQT